MTLKALFRQLKSNLVTHFTKKHNVCYFYDYFIIFSVVGIADDWQKTNLNFEAELHRYRDRNVFMEFYGQKMTARKYELTPGKYLMMPVGFQ